MKTRPARKRKKARRAPLVIDRSLPRPALVCALADGVEAIAHAHATASGHAYAGYVPLAQALRVGNIATTTQYAPQAIKWNVRASDATLILTADANLFGRARHAQLWSARYRKPWLHLWPAVFDTARFQQWLHTHSVSVLHLTGPASYQAPALGGFVEQIMNALWRER